MSDCLSEDFIPFETFLPEVMSSSSVAFTVHPQAHPWLSHLRHSQGVWRFGTGHTVELCIEDDWMDSMPGWSLSDGDFQSRAVILSHLTLGMSSVSPHRFFLESPWFYRKWLFGLQPRRGMTLKGRRHGSGWRLSRSRVRKRAGGELSVSSPQYPPLLHSP